MVFNATNNTSADVTANVKNFFENNPVVGYTIKDDVITIEPLSTTMADGSVTLVSGSSNLAEGATSVTEGGVDVLIRTSTTIVVYNTDNPDCPGLHRRHPAQRRDHHHRAGTPWPTAAMLTLAPPPSSSPT